MTALWRNESKCKLTNTKFAVNIKYFRHKTVCVIPARLQHYLFTAALLLLRVINTERRSQGEGGQGGGNALVEIQLTAKAISECAKCCQQAWCLCMKYRQYDWPIGSHCQPDGWLLKGSKATAVRAQSISLLKEIQGLNRGKTFY